MLFKYSLRFHRLLSFISAYKYLRFAAEIPTLRIVSIASNTVAFLQYFQTNQYTSESYLLLMQDVFLSDSIRLGDYHLDK